MRHKKLNSETLNALAAKFSALGEVSRLLIVESLQQGEMSVTELTNCTDLSQPNVSRHLKVLIHAGLIKKRREGVNIIYYLADETLSKVCSLVCGSLANKLV